MELQLCVVLMLGMVDEYVVNLLLLLVAEFAALQCPQGYALGVFSTPFEVLSLPDLDATHAGHYILFLMPYS